MVAMLSAKLAEESGESNATCAGAEAIALWIDALSIPQTTRRNSERRRKALVSNCACIGLESATRTQIAPAVAAGNGLMDRSPSCNLTMHGLWQHRPDITRIPRTIFGCDSQIGNSKCGGVDS